MGLFWGFFFVERVNSFFLLDTPENGSADPIVISLAVIILLECHFMNFCVFRPQILLIVFILQPQSYNFQAKRSEASSR